MEIDANPELESLNTSTNEEPREGTEETPTESQDLVDLSRYSRVKLGDKEWSRDELEKGVMFQSDYTKKTQEIAQERRYVDNLQADLASVAKNPAMVSEFKKIYPAKFHQFLDYVMPKTNGTAQGQTPQSSIQNADPRIEQVLSRVENWEKTMQEERVSTAKVEVDSIFNKFSQKYPLAAPKGDESRVIAQAQSLLEKGETMTEAKWEKIFKDSQMHYETAYKEYYKDINNKQKAAHVRGKDIAAGGGVPGGAPNLPKNIKDATKLAMQDLVPQK